MTAKIIVISDSHGNPDKIESVLAKERDAKTIVFCGDGLRDWAFVKLPKETRLLKVMGNTDIYVNDGSESEILQEIYGRKIYIAHGHHHGVKSRLEFIAETARERCAQVVLFGHTHSPCLIEGEPILFNPGALKDNRYGIIEVTSEGYWKFSHKSL